MSSTIVVENVTNNIVNDTVKEYINNFTKKFTMRHSHQPPEFTDKRIWYHFRDMYEEYISDITHPIHTSWFYELITSANQKDLDELVNAFNNKEMVESYYFCMMRYVQQNLLEKAYQLDKKNVPISKSIPEWFRNAGWTISSKWNCEKV